MLINGNWVASSTGEQLVSVNPFNQEGWATIPQASTEDVHNAIAAARDAFDSHWKYVSGLKRADQTCIAGSRLLVQKNIYEEVVKKIVKKAKSIKLGNPLDPRTEMGPVANEAQYKRILFLIEQALRDGARLVLGGQPVRDNGLEKGYFIAPTVFADVDNKMMIAQEEVFGPVLSIIPFETEEEAIKIANDTKYGLASGIWTSDVKRVHRLARAIQAGTVWVNTYRTTAAQAPFGGIQV